MHKNNKHKWSVLILLHLGFSWVGVDSGGGQCCKSFFAILQMHDFFLL